MTLTPYQIEDLRNKLDRAMRMAESGNIAGAHGVLSTATTSLASTLDQIEGAATRPLRATRPDTSHLATMILDRDFRAVSPPARLRSPRYIETTGGTILDGDGRTVATLELRNVMTAEAVQIMQTILAALNAQKDPKE